MQGCSTDVYICGVVHLFLPVAMHNYANNLKYNLNTSFILQKVFGTLIALQAGESLYNTRKCK
jgi:hypothetical protein